MVTETVSIIGASYLQPIADLVDRALRWPATKRGAPSALYYDNAYSVSIVLLLAALVESYATRVRYFKGMPTGIARSTVAQYLKGVFPDFRLMKALTEVFVLRDAIFHNHLWTVDFTYRPMRVKSATLVPHREDTKFKSAVRTGGTRTQTLKLHIVPTRVDRRDTVKVLEVVWKTLLFIESKDRRYCYVSDHNVSFRGRMKPFAEVQSVLASAL